MFTQVLEILTEKLSCSQTSQIICNLLFDRKDQHQMICRDFCQRENCGQLVDDTQNSLSESKGKGANEPNVAAASHSSFMSRRFGVTFSSSFTAASAAVTATGIAAMAVATAWQMMTALYRLLLPALHSDFNWLKSTENKLKSKRFNKVLQANLSTFTSFPCRWNLFVGCTG